MLVLAITGLPTAFILLPSSHNDERQERVLDQMKCSLDSLKQLLTFPRALLQDSSVGRFIELQIVKQVNCIFAGGIARDALDSAVTCNGKRESEPATPVYRTIEEKVWQHIQRIMAQKRRESILLIPDRLPVGITTPTLREYFSDDDTVRKFVAAIHRKNGTLTATEVDSLIENRY